MSSVADDFADMLSEQKRMLMGFIPEAAQYGLRSQIEGALFRLSMVWTQCRRGEVDLDAIFAAQTEGDGVFDAVMVERFGRVREQEMMDTLVDVYGAADVENRAATGWYEQWEIDAAFKTARERAAIEF